MFSLAPAQIFIANVLFKCIEEQQRTLNNRKKHFAYPSGLNSGFNLKVKLGISVKIMVFFLLLDL